MSSKISSYGIAQDNIAMGMDMVATAQDSISLMQSHGERIMSLWNQAQNGTYGNQSLQAIQSEVNARMAEIERLYNTTEYNGTSLLGYDMPDWTNEVKANAGVNAGADITTNESGFIDDIVTVTPDVIVTDPTQLASAISSNTKIGIGNAETLAKLAELVNSGTTCSGKTILLTEDIDLSAYQDGAGWTPIGNTDTSSKNFAGTFDGQGHKITNLKINNPTTDYQGLFGRFFEEDKGILLLTHPLSEAMLIIVPNIGAKILFARNWE
jgi:flagellin-like hook-associated protein FlgL